VCHDLGPAWAWVNSTPTVAFALLHPLHWLLYGFEIHLEIAMPACRRALFVRISCTALLWAAAIDPATDAEFARLSRYLPADANAVIVVNAASMYDSPLGKRENWRQRFAEASQATPMLVPPIAQACVLAAKLDFATLRPDWEAAVMTLSIDPTAADIVRRRGGTTDMIGNFEAAWINPKICVLKFAPRLVGVHTSASRQDMARWAARVSANSEANLSPYLQQAVSYADSVGTELILAVDLAGALSPAQIGAAVTGSSVLKGLPRDQVVALLASIQGVKFGVLVGEKLQGRLEFDFAQDASLLAPVAKPLILAAVSRAGGMLEEFNAWTPEAKEKSLAIKGELTLPGLRRMLSLIAIDAGAVDSGEALAAATSPAATVPPAPKGTSPGAAKPNPMAAASLRYFRAVDEYVQDSKRLNRADSLQQAVMWLENYARRIESLPTRSVDPDLIQFGNYVAQTFRSIVDQAYGVAQKAEEAAAGSGPTEYRIGLLPTARTVNWGGYRMREYAPYGYIQGSTQASEQSEQKTQDEIYKAVQEAQQTLSKLIADHETARSTLTQRYGVKF
jgi:hypothetical protein